MGFISPSAVLSPLQPSGQLAIGAGLQDAQGQNVQEQENHERDMPPLPPRYERSGPPPLRAVAVGEPGYRRFASGKVIIRRGDNLWTIARRVYGMGRRYVTIYEANRDQISDPHWIYPGQVFDLPLD